MQTVRVLPRESEVDAGGRHVKAPDCGTCGTPQSAALAQARVPSVFCLGPILFLNGSFTTLCFAITSLEFAFSWL